VSATSGSSGRKSVIVTDSHEWAAVIVSYARANEWAGIHTGLTHRVRMAVVSSTAPWHQSSRVAATVRSPFVVSERLDAANPLPGIVARLNQLQPDVLIAYASMIRVLAREQLDGRLRITPRGVNSSSEVLTAEARADATRAWNVAPFNVYAATETGGIAAECDQHQGMHLFEDLVIPEIVDNNYHPVPPGDTGDRLLVTVLSSRTLPLIRYEMTDRVAVTTRTCPCGRPFRLLQAIDGRTDDMLELPGHDGGMVTVHPVVFHRELDLLDATGWQVRQREGQLEIQVAGAGLGFDPVDTERRLHAALAAANVWSIPLRLSVVDTIPAGAAGKRPLIIAQRRSDQQPTPPDDDPRPATEDGEN
jgi:phenylacetate-coenzyme A ligase PaaK-like adenylate-forming protein